MTNENYDEEYLNKAIQEQEDEEIENVSIEQQRYILTDGSTFKCHIHEIDDTILSIADSFSDIEDLEQ
jgi:hypothetical protein